MVFTFLNVWETSKEYFVTHENDKKFRLNEVVSQHSRGHSLACHLRLRSGRSRIVGEKPEVFTTWPFAEEVCRGRSEGSFSQLSLIRHLVLRGWRRGGMEVSSNGPQAWLRIGITCRTTD